MNYLLEVCLVALTLTTNAASAVVAQSEAHAHLPLQKGISVELPVTSNAVPVPDADREDASIVTVTDTGSVYLGIGPTTTAALAEKVRGGLSNRPEKNLYIKADARTPYASLVKVLDAVRMAGVETLKLLTAQTDSSEPGALVSPKGLEVLVGPRLASSSSSQTIVLHVLKSAQQRHTLKINDEDVPWATLQIALRQLFQNGSERVVLVKAEGILPFADVVAVTDMCLSTGAKVVLVTPGQ
jgi:biopolymer transport protein ExbD